MYEWKRRNENIFNYNYNIYITCCYISYQRYDITQFHVCMSFNLHYISMKNAPIYSRYNKNLNET